MMISETRFTNKNYFKINSYRIRLSAQKVFLPHYYNILIKPYWHTQATPFFTIRCNNTLIPCRANIRRIIVY